MAMTASLRHRLGLVAAYILIAGLVPLGVLGTPAPASAAADHLLLTEVVVTPTGGEFVEIHNPTGSTIDLTDVYLTDATFSGGPQYYYFIAGGGAPGGGGFSDFHARFPTGATIAAGEYQTVALAGSINFISEYGIPPTYELYEDDGAPDGVPDMLEAAAGLINNQGGLSNGGEVVILYQWDGSSDLVEDLDYFLWGDKAEAVDKTGVTIGTSTYLDDTEIASQDVVDTDAHTFGMSWQRSDLDEGAETSSGGNGATGHDETSEDLSNTWTEAAPTPGAALPVVAPEFLINEVDADTPSTDTAEFVEIYDGGAGNTALDGLVLVFYNGSDDKSYEAYDLDGETTNGDGYFVAGNAAVSGVDLVFSDGSLQNGADAVALYTGNAADFPNDTPLTTTNLIDAVVYDTDDADDAGLLALLNASEPQVDEDGKGDKDNQSNQRCPDGSGGARNTSTFNQWAPTPGAVNTCLPLVPVELYIHEIQGSGATSPYAGAEVIVEAVVVADFQDTGLNGFNLQEEDLDADSDPLTSEGIFVYEGGSAVNVEVGDLVEVHGTAAEYNGLTEITSVTSVVVNDTGVALPTPATLSFPVAAVDDLEAFEGMSVYIPQDMYIADYWNYDRYVEVYLASERLFTPTAIYEPGSTAAADLADFNDRAQIFLDDGDTVQNPEVTRHPNGLPFSLANSFRGGDIVSDVVGVLDYARDAYRIQPTAGATFTVDNPRPASPAPVGGSLKVAAFNVLNYFSTIDAGPDICGPLADQDCRGADNATEFDRQQAKIVAALAEIDADIVGLMEIENHATDAAIIDLVGALNAEVGAGTYDYVATGPAGPDAIRVALIYKPATVALDGSHAVLDDPGFLDPNNTGSDRNRAAVAQTFMEIATGESLTVVVNHFKSKGSECGIGDDDPEAGSCNLTRTLAAAVLTDWLATDPTGSGDPDVLVIGDLNSYDKEDPIDAMKLGPDDAPGTGDDYRDLVREFQGERAYSYVFSAELGYLDYAMANESLRGDVTGTTVWHINADEVDLIDYDTGFKSAGQIATFAEDAYRSSDHDPVIVGLDMANPMGLVEKVVGDLEDLLPTGSKNDDKKIEHALTDLGEALDPDLWTGDDTLDPKHGHKVFDNLKQAVNQLTKVDDPAAEDAIEMLVEIARWLARTAIDDAIAHEGDARKIAKAEDQYADGLAETADEDYDKAIGDFRSAWDSALKAVKEIAVRFATFNASLNRFNEGDLRDELSSPGSAQPSVIAEIIQRNRPDVLLINEFDYDPTGFAPGYFQTNYLSVPQNGADPIVYPYRYSAPSNTGIPSGFDLDNSGSVGGPNDAFGFGYFPGQYGMVVYSMYPIDYDEIRTFQNFLWKDMPGALLPDDPDTAGVPADWYSPDELNVVRLSSKSHWDVPIEVGKDVVHFLVSHPTPPVFDGPEDRNGTRNYDEIRFWADYVTPGQGGYIYDDDGGTGGLPGKARFVIAGDQNSDPFDGDSIPGAIQQLLNSPRINTSVTPSSAGAVEQAALQDAINDSHISDPAYDTADFADSTPGNLRADYVLPSKQLEIWDSAVFWPLEADPLFWLVGTYPFPGTDHRLVWVDVLVK